MNEVDVINPYGFIYLTTNYINGKRYIGQKKFDNASRWKSYLGSGSYLSNAVNKYGKDNFSREIIAIAYSLEELNKLEENIINDHNVVNSKDYYNQMEGGDVVSALNRSNYVKVICIDNDMIFDSIVDASIYANCSTTMITNSFKRKHTSSYKKEDLIFRRLIKEGKCCVCGKNAMHNKSRYCSKCLDIIKNTSFCVKCGYSFIKKCNAHKYCSKCSKG